MTQILILVVAVVTFLVLYALLHERASRKSGSRPPLRWGWLAAIAGCVLVAGLAGLVL